MCKRGVKRMPFNDEGMLDNDQAKIILQNMVDAGRAGLFSWDIDKNRFQVMETFTGKTFNQINTLEEFLHEMVFHKDVRLALQDLNRFMTGVDDSYQSTFRILDYNGEIRWLFTKGTMQSENRMSAMMYDVTEGNLQQGHDHRTNLMNSDTFMRKLKNAIQCTKDADQHGALLYIDIGNFHSIINKHGFEFGSQILHKFSRILLEFVGKQDEIGRFPYDKFMILLNDITALPEVEQTAQSISSFFDEPIYIEGKQIYLNINIGITLFPDASLDVDELMRYSDFAINHARQSGNQSAVFFDSELMASYNREMDIENELPTAIYNQELSLVYQPQLGLRNKDITGFEVLVRWNNKNLGFVSPGEFIPIAEEKGYIVAIGRWIREESLKTARIWLDRGIEFEKLSINISTVEIAQKGFKEQLLHLCARYNIEPRMIELEITERTFMMTEDDENNIFTEIVKEGFKIALDDFGTGYSNLRSLTAFQINTLKLDKSLIDNIKDYKQRHIILGILGAKTYLYDEIVAEGVEDKETLDILSDLGFDTIQGYYFCRPLSRSDMEQFISAFRATNHY